MRIACLGTLRFEHWCEDARQHPTILLTAVIGVLSRRVDHHLDLESRPVRSRGWGNDDRTEGGVRRSDFGHKKEKKDGERADSRTEEDHDEISTRYGLIKYGSMRLEMKTENEGFALI